MITKTREIHYGFDPSEKEIYPQCQIACPILTDIPLYIRLLSLDRLGEAYEILRQVNPLPGSLGRICHHPCEEECRRGDVDGALSCASLKRFITDNYRGSVVESLPIKYEERVAIIGGGPAGISAAYELVKMGYRVTVFEKERKIGGMLSSCIPRYRLPRQIIDEDIEYIQRLGVEIRCNSMIDPDRFWGLLQGEYHSVLLSTGLPIAKGLKIQGVEADKVLLSLPFLRSINLGEKVDIGKRVMVIGGGNVAIDCARSARRLGAEVEIVCLERRDEMPAFEWEVEEAEKEGVKLNCALGPKKILHKNGAITALECMAVRSVFDENGRFAPTFYPERISVLECDTVIIAIGQDPDLSYLREIGIEIRPKEIKTNKAGIFACGDLVNGPTTAVEAIASGKKASYYIHKYLRKEPIGDLEATLPTLGGFSQDTIRRVKRLERVKLPSLDLKERIGNFKEVNLGYGLRESLLESRRCLTCGGGAEWIEEKCVLCLTCVRSCPIEAPKLKDGEIHIDPGECQVCGVCQSVCPAKAITLRDKYYKSDWIRGEIEDLLKEGPTPIEMGCAYLEIIHDSEFSLKVLCLERIEISHILYAFQLGADEVGVYACKNDECKFGREERITKRLHYIRNLLRELQIDEKFKIYE